MSNEKSVESSTSLRTRFSNWYADDRHRELTAIISTSVLQVIWTSLQLTMKALADKLYGASQAAMRIWISVPCLLVFWLIFEARKPGLTKPWAPFMVARNWLYLLPIAVIGNICNLVLISTAFSFPNTTAGAVATILALQIIFTPIAGAIFGEGRLNIFMGLGCLLGFVGVILVMNPVKLVEDLSAGSGIGDYVGMLIVLGNCLAFSGFIVINRKYMRLTKLSVFSAQLGIGTLSGILILIFGGYWIIPDLNRAVNEDALSGTDWGLLFYSGLFGSCIGYVMNTFGMANIRAPAVYSAIQALLPITSTIGGIIFFDEAVTAWLAGGIAVVGLAIAIILYGRSRDMKADDAAKAKAATAVELAPCDEQGAASLVASVASLAESPASSVVEAVEAVELAYSSPSAESMGVDL